MNRKNIAWKRKVSLKYIDERIKHYFLVWLVNVRNNFVSNEFTQ